MVKIKNLNYSYNNSHKILKNVNLEIGESKLVALVGVNGCGKTTLIKNILGLLNHQNSVDIKVPVNEIGYLEQGDELFPNLSVIETINLVKSFYNVKTNW